MNAVVSGAAVVPSVCPVAPPGAQAFANTLTGYVLWGVLALMLVGVVVSIGAVVGGRVFSMPHASKAGVVGVVVVFVSAVAYMVVPGMLSGITGIGLRVMGAATAPTAEQWDRRRLLRTLVLVTLAGVALLAGLGFAVHSAATSIGRSDTEPTPAGQAAEQMPPGQARRDAIAAAPMLTVPPQAGRVGHPGGHTRPDDHHPPSRAGRPGPGPHRLPPHAGGCARAAGRHRDERAAGHVHRACPPGPPGVGGPGRGPGRRVGAHREHPGLPRQRRRGPRRRAHHGRRHHTRRRPGEGHRRARLGAGVCAAGRQGPPASPRRGSPTGTANGCSGPTPTPAAG